MPQQPTSSSIGLFCVNIGPPSYTPLTPGGDPVGAPQRRYVRDVVRARLPSGPGRWPGRCASTATLGRASPRPRGRRAPRPSACLEHVDDVDVLAMDDEIGALRPRRTAASAPSPRRTAPEPQPPVGRGLYALKKCFERGTPRSTAGSPQARPSTRWRGRSSPVRPPAALADGRLDRPAPAAVPLTDEVREGGHPAVQGAVRLPHVLGQPSAMDASSWLPMWTCASMRPGSTYCSRASIVR